MRSAERVELVEKHGKGMLLDTKLLRQMRTRVEIYRFACPEELELDVSRMEPEVAAEVIYQHVVKVTSRKERKS